jgi:hypothetical protein
MNRQETKLLVENWRKMLNDIPNNEEMMLNEINLKNTLLTLAMSAAALVPNYSGAVPTSTIQGEISTSVENRTDGAISAYNVPGDNGYMTILAQSQEGAEKTAAKYKESGKENPNILIYGSDDARNISVRELVILNLAVEYGGPLTKLAKQARRDNSDDLANKFNQEVARSISAMSDEEIEGMYDIANSAIGADNMKDLTNFALKKINLNSPYSGPDGAGELNPDDIDVEDNREYSKKHDGNITFKSFDGYSEIASKKVGLVFLFVLPKIYDESGSGGDRLRSKMFDRTNGNFDFKKLLIKN